VKVAVTGATGLIGSALVRELVVRGDEVTALSRNAGRARAKLGVDASAWERPTLDRPSPDSLRGRDGVVNLLGEPLAQRWTEDAKREIRDSRILATRNLVDAMADLPEGERPGVLVSQSGIDWYGACGDERVDESEPPASGFIAQLTVDWEAEARRAEQLGVRVFTTRTGVVLSPSGGALERMLPPFRLGVGGPAAGGSQYVSWIHLDDVVGALAFCLHTDAPGGPVNVTAPEPVTNRDFSKALGRVLRRPAVLPVPALALKVLYGEMSVVVTTGRRAVPARLLELGYEFRQPDLEDALRNAVAGRA
jgi:uncharacterized protein